MRRNVPRRGQDSVDRELLAKLRKHKDISSSSSSSTLTSYASESDSDGEWTDETPPQRILRLRKVSSKPQHKKEPSPPDEPAAPLLRVRHRQDLKMTEIPKKPKVTTSHLTILERICDDIESSTDNDSTPIEVVSSKPAPHIIINVSSTSDDTSSVPKEPRRSKLAAFRTSSKPISAIKDSEEDFAKAPIGRQGSRFAAVLAAMEKKEVLKITEDSLSLESSGDVISISLSSAESSFEALRTTPVIPTLNSVLDLPVPDIEETNPNLVCFEQSQVEPKVVYLFSVVESNKKLFLFCKNREQNDQYQTVCICITNPCYTLSFIARSGVDKSEVFDEAETLIKACGGNVTTKVWEVKTDLDETETNCLTLMVTATLDLTQLPVHGKTFEAITGATQSLVDAFLAQKKVRLGQWISARCYQSPYSLTTVPFYTVTSPSEITVEDISVKPQFNVCAMAVHVYNGEVFLISMRIFSQWDIDLFDIAGDVSQSCQKVVSFVVAPKPNGQGSESTFYCQNETELLYLFLDKIDKEDVDFLVGYDLKATVPFLLTRMKANSVSEWHKLGRMPHSGLNQSVLGRFVCDLKGFFEKLFVKRIDGFSALVFDVLNIQRPNIPESRQHAVLSGSPSEFSSLIMSSRKDTMYMRMLLQKFSILLTCQLVSQLTGIGWTDVTLNDDSSVIESYFSKFLSTQGFLVQDRRQVGKTGHFHLPSCKFGLHYGTILVVQAPFWFLQFLKAENISITPGGSNTILPSMITRLLSCEDTENEAMKSATQIISSCICCFLSGTSKRFELDEISSAVEREFKKLMEEFDEVLMTTPDTIIAAVTDVDACRESLSSRWKNIQNMAAFDRVFISDSNSYAAFDTVTNTFSNECHVVRWNWSRITKTLCTRVFEICMKSPEPFVDVFSEIEKQARQFQKTKPSDWAYKATSVSSELKKGQSSSMCDCVDIVRCKGGILKETEAVKDDLSRVDIENSIKQEMIPAILMITEPFMKIPKAQLLESLLNTEDSHSNNEDLLFECPHCQKRVPYLEDSPLKCVSCGVEVNWKLLTNLLCRSIRSVIESCAQQPVHCTMWLCTYSTDQLPVTAPCLTHRAPTNLYSTCTGKSRYEMTHTNNYQRLKSYESMFDPSEYDFDDIVALKEVMRDYIHDILKYHNLNRLKLSALVSSPESI